MPEILGALEKPPLPTLPHTGGGLNFTADLDALFPASFTDSPLGEIPAGWEVRSVGDVAELRGGKQLAKERITAIGIIPVFGGAGVMGFTDSHNAEGFVISVGRVGAYCGQFFSHRGKAWINNNASIVLPFEGVSAEWLFQALRHSNIEVIKKGAAQPFVSNTDIAKMPIIYPGKEINFMFLTIIIPLIMKMEKNNKVYLTLATLRDTLLPKLISGQIRVKDAEKQVNQSL